MSHACAHCQLIFRSLFHFTRTRFWLAAADALFPNLLGFSAPHYATTPCAYASLAMIWSRCGMLTIEPKEATAGLDASAALAASLTSLVLA